MSDIIKIRLIGENASDVTGSCTYVQTDYNRILIECGQYQESRCTVEGYNKNAAPFPFKAPEIDYVFACHAHIDHIGLLPLLVRRGYTGTIIVPTGNIKVMGKLLLDGAKVNKANANTLSVLYRRDFSPIYTHEDAEKAVSLMKEYPFDKVFKLNDNVSFRFVSSGHIFASAQLELWPIKTKKILYTSDLGNTHLDPVYTTPFSPVEQADIVIGECTYGGESRIAGRKMRKQELNDFGNLIEETIHKRGKILIPTFANARSQEMLTVLYRTFASDPLFRIPVILDSPMACKISELYEELLTGDKLKIWKSVRNWDRVRFVTEDTESKAWQNDFSPLIAMATNGMMTAGRSRAWCRNILSSSRDTMIFCGYSAPDTLAAIIKNPEKDKIKLSGQWVIKRCNVMDMHSFTSHMQQDSLIEYYSDIDSKKVVLVHGSEESKQALAPLLQKAISRKNKTSQVIVSRKDMEITI